MFCLNFPLLSVGQFEEVCFCALMKQEGCVVVEDELNSHMSLFVATLF